MFNFESYLPTRILVGNKKIEEIGKQVKQYGDRALLVTGKKSMKESGFTDRIIQLLESEAVTVDLFDKIETNPTREIINEGGAFAKELGSQVIVGLGGGSALDSAKGIAVLAKEGSDIWEYVEGKSVPNFILPIVAAPSTAGTGSEVTLYAVITDKASRRKDGFMSEHIFPRVAIIDPELMSTVPPKLTAYAGADALAQAVEAYLTKLAHPFSDLLALESAKLIVNNLPKVVKDGKNLAARTAMGWASSLAGIAISLVDVVIGHHASEAIGALFETHHGATAGILLPYAMEFNFDQCKKRLAALADLMEADTAGMSQSEAARKSIAMIKKLYQKIELPEKLSSIGVDKAAIPELVDYLLSRKEDLDAGNPRECSAENMKEYLEMAI
jgi:alcohol dehydrogenase class IV